ncbi:MAG TPA: hypothetical protein VMV72_14230 [Verrucomicrobiae bacterium]|nr:hypothetical protein [Verrucomicrobiae bacterium]
MQEFRISRGFKFLIYTGFALSCFIVVACAARGFPAKRRGTAAVYAFGVIFFGLSAAGALRVIRRFNDRVQVDDFGITYIRQNGEALRMDWQDVRKVVTGDVLGRLDLYDFSNHRMRLAYQIEGFSTLMMILRENLEHLFEGTAKQTIFHKSAIYFASWLIIFAFCLLPLWAGVATGKRQPIIIGSLFAALWLFVLSTESCSVRIAETGIEIRYPLRTRMLRFREICDIDVRDLPGRGGTIPAVVISLDGNATVNLTRYRGGHLALCHALRSAWEKATEQPPQTYPP